MASVGEATFAGTRLRLARTFAGLTQVELGERVSVSHQFIGYLESGHKLPSAVVVDALGEACGFEPYFFFGPNLPEFREEECHFRRRQTTPVSVRTRLLAHGTLFGQLVDFLEERLSLPAMRVPEVRVREREDIERAAERCRLEWGLGRDLPIKSMTRVLENAGVVVTRFEGAALKVDAFSRAGRRSVVVLNTDKGCASRSRFDMAHECGHLVMHGGIETGGVETEKEADLFASSFLLPRVGFVREFPRMVRLDWPALFRLKERWRVSAAALVRRAYDLRLIDAMQYQRAYKYMAAQGWRKGEPGEFAPEDPEMVPLALDALWQQRLNARALAAALGWRSATLAQVAGITVPEGDDPPADFGAAQVIHLPHRRS